MAADKDSEDFVEKYQHQYLPYCAHHLNFFIILSCRCLVSIFCSAMFVLNLLAGFVICSCYCISIRFFFPYRRHLSLHFWMHRKILDHLNFFRCSMLTRGLFWRSLCFSGNLEQGSTRNLSLKSCFCERLQIYQVRGHPFRISILENYKLRKIITWS